MENYTRYTLVEEVQSLKKVFDSVDIVEPIMGYKYEIVGENLKKLRTECKKDCCALKLGGDCMCSKVATKTEQFIFDGDNIYLIMYRPIMLNKEQLVVVMSMKLSNEFKANTSQHEGIANKLVNKDISNALYIDELTGVYNRKYITDKILFEVKKNVSDCVNVNVACVDIDNFKGFNDTYGHSFGDLVLKELSGILKDGIGSKGSVIRIGGDEFIVVSSGLSKESFLNKMRSCCIEVNDTQLKTSKYRGNSGTVSISISIGCSSSDKDGLTKYEELYDKADSRLYRSKALGKNCVT